MPVKKPVNKVADTTAKLRLTPREIMQIKELLKNENQMKEAVPSIAHLAGTIDSEFMEELRQLIRENREKEAARLAEEEE